MQHPQVGIKGVQGRQREGLTKETNENRKDIAETLASRPDTQCAIFVFGNVGVHMSYYFLRHGRHPPESIDFNKIAKEYIAFIAGLPGEELKRIVIGCYPSSLIEPESVPQSLEAYGVLTEEQAKTIELSDCTLEKRQGRARAFNAALRAACEGLQWPESEMVEYIDIFDDLVDPDTLQLRPDYLDISTCNIHVVWETTILKWLEKFEWLAERVPEGFTEKMPRA